MTSYVNSSKNDNDYDGAESSDLDDDKDDDQASDEDTADASETEDKPKNSHVSTSGQRTEIKEQMYQDKLAQIKKQIGMLKEGSLPEFLKRTKKIEVQYRERLSQNEIDKTVEVRLAA
ncbi:sin3 histone deacetylase corepressor complex component sds3 [Plakobranchus ocellatus]|uniref:Sin3 histone deacetylase corepressor complex component sds3 n=1 Tax=Plakobranchus ocellatus TaxID=259542 RepID=A0AAV3ZRB9_9GAST|nr:sin3 histone deacetylase corepressor complex component sds3 [Plakobranchus ocellatus]